MVPTKRLIYEFDRRYDRFKSEAKSSLRLEDKLSVLNEAVQMYFENRVKLAETTSSVLDDLRPFLVSEESLKITKRADRFVIASIPDRCYKLLRRRVLATKPGCKLNKRLPIVMAQEDDLERMLSNSFWAPSFEWENALGNQTSEGLYVWTNNEFKVEEVIVSYYKKPQELHAPSMSTTGSYEDWNGKIVKKDQDLEFDATFAYRKILDLAVLIARNDVGDVRDFQMQLSKILQVESAFMK